MCRRLRASCDSLRSLCRKRDVAFCDAATGPLPIPVAAVLGSWTMNPRPILLTLVLLAGSFFAAWAIAYPSLGLQPNVVRYSGAALWALALYWIVSALFPRARLFLVGLLTGVLATGIEYLKLLHLSRVEAFLGNLPRILVSSPNFDRWAILDYWLIIAIGASIDSGIRSRPRERTW